MLGNCPISPPGGWGVQKPPRGVAIDRSHSLASRLVGFWPLSEAVGGSVNDAAGGNFRGVINGAAWATTIRGSALSFAAASNNYVNCGLNPSLDAPGDMTVMALAYPTAAALYANYQIVSKSGATYTDSAWELKISNPSTARLMLTATNGTDVFEAAKVGVSINTWYVFMGTIRNNVMTAYVNGIAGSPVTLTGTRSRAASAKMCIGTRWYSGGPNNSYTGLVSSIALWNRALLPAEVQQVSTQPYCMFESGGPIVGQAGSRQLVDGSLASDTQLLGAVV